MRENMSGMKDVTDPGEPISPLVEEVLELLEDYGMPKEISDRVVKLIEFAEKQIDELALQEGSPRYSR